MNIIDLEESYLLSFTHAHNSIFIELRFLLDNGEKIIFFAHNKEGSPIKVNYQGLDIKANFTTIDNIPSLGEVECVGTTNSGCSFEGDFGFIDVVADTWSIDKAL